MSSRNPIGKLLRCAAMNFVCVQCGKRQPPGDRCTKCGEDNLLDLGKEQTRDLLLDIDLRLRQKREGMIRLAAVVIGIAIVVVLWTVPGYWHARGRIYPGLPFLLDQWAFMIVLALGAMKLLSLKFSAKPKFPFMDRITGQVRD
jgi:hypothetical protein